MTTKPDPPPDAVAASWWDESCALGPSFARRDLLKALLGAGAASATAGALYAGTQVTVTRDALDVQRELGWSFGATGEPLVFDGETEHPYDSAALSTLVASLRPSSPAHRPHYVATLLEAPVAEPTPAELEAGAPRLADLLVPICTAEMTRAYRRGEALAARLGAARDTLVVLDLAGPESVAFAAGMARAFDVVLGFDNWPHPRGVVASHLTLAAIVYYQPRFARAAVDRLADAPAVLALDRDRLTPQSDKLSRFDNRYLASVPTVDGLRELGVTRVLYVVPDAETTLEQDDLNADFVAWAASGVDLRRASADSLDASDHADVVLAHAAVARRTMFSWSEGEARKPDGFGAVAVLVTASTGKAQGVLFGMSQLGCCAGDDDGWNRGTSSGSLGGTRGARRWVARDRRGARRWRRPQTGRATPQSERRTSRAEGTSSSFRRRRRSPAAKATSTAEPKLGSASSRLRAGRASPQVRERTALKRDKRAELRGANGRVHRGFVRQASEGRPLCAASSFQGLPPRRLLLRHP